MRAWGNGIAGKAMATMAVAAVAAAVLLGQPLMASAAPGPLTITPLGWNVVGLDSNNVNAGPNVFPVGGRVCNTGTNPVTNVGVNWNWLSANTYVNLTNTTSFSTASLGASACRDYYFNVQVTRNSSAYNTARQFQITATGDSVSAVSTPANREIYVEKLVSQNRNAVTALALVNNPGAGCITATETVYVGSTCTVNITAKTAPGGYAQLVTAFYFNNSMFQIESFTASYPTPAGGTNTQMYADGCGWNNDRTSGTYQSCIGPDGFTGGKVGGNGMTLAITFKVLATGSQNVSGMIYDFSGSSFHYNDDGGSEPNLLVLTSTYGPTAPDAVNDSGTTNEDTNVDIDVLANDSDVNGNLNPSSLSVATQPSNGTASVVGGQVRYSPSANFNGSDSFTYQICDSTSPTPLCSTATVNVTVTSVNDPPDAVNDSRTINEDASLTFDPRGNDTDPDGNALTVTGTGSASNGTVSFTGTSVTYTPNTNFFGSDSFTYTISDGNGGTDTATVTITVNAVNDGPTAVNDSDSVNEDSSVTVDVLGNDTDVDDGLDPASVNVTSGPSNGSTSVNPSGSIDYTPDPDFFGTDSFTYQVCDFAGLCDTATVDITINEVNDGPTARNDSDTVNEDASVTVDVLGNDSDPDDGLDPSSVTVTGAPSNGSTSVNPSGSIDYTPDPNFFGTDSFTYEVCDFAGLCDSAIVDITINSVNDGPDAVDDSALVNEDSSVTVDVLGNDTDVEGAIDPSSVNVTSGPSNGSTSVNPDGSIDYTPDPDFYGTDSFTYQVCDVDGDCDTATVDIAVSGINDGPDAVDDSDTVNEDSSVTVDVLGNDTDIDDGLDPSSVSVTSGPSNGSTSVNANGSIDYTPDPNFFGTDSFTYQVCDFAGLCDSAIVDITIDSVNDSPAAIDDSGAGIWGTDIDIDILANDSDPDGAIDDSSVSITSGPSNGTVSVNADGSITYVADDGFVGNDSFMYQVCDDGTPTECDTATVDITVSANQGPDASDDTATVDEDSGPVTIDVLTNDSDPEGGALTVTSAGPASNGTVTVNPNGTIDYTPDTNFSGTDTFTYTVCDVAGNCSTATVTVTVNEVNDPPTARNDSDRVREGRTINVGILANDSDGDNALDPMTVSILTQPSHGSVSVNADGSVDFTADAGYDGPDSFQYEVCDDGTPAECDTATVELDIWLRDPNRRPDAVDDSVTTPEDTSVTINVRGNDTDPDGDALTISNFSQPKHGTVSSSGGRLVFAPDANWNGSTTFTYTVCDPGGRCDDATVTVTVDPVDDAPVANDDAIVVKDGKPVDVPVVDNDDEVDGEPVTVDVVDQPDNGTVTVNADGTVTYTPDDGYDGSDDFTYEICDPDGDCSEATVSVEVDGSSVPVDKPSEPNAPDPEPQASELPHTGGDVTRLALWGVTLLLMGATMVRRRRTRLG